MKFKIASSPIDLEERIVEARLSIGPEGSLRLYIEGYIVLRIDTNGQSYLPGDIGHDARLKLSEDSNDCLDVRKES